MNLDDLGWKTYITEGNLLDMPIEGQIGRITSVQKNAFLILSEPGSCWGKLSGNLSYHAQDCRELPVVGDWVSFNLSGDSATAVITELFPRKNRIARVAAGSRGRRSTAALTQQVIAANIELIFIVAGLDRDYNLRRIERYLTLAYDSEAIPIVLLNKADLCSTWQEKTQEVEEIAIGVPVYAISASSGFDIGIVHRHLLPGMTAALLGSSGVGKSTIINSLLGKERQATHAISDSVGKGVHTTTARELILLPKGGMIVDNPGIRELQLITDSDSLETAFEDIEALAETCRFSDCRHEAEPGCSVKLALLEGSLDEERYQSYLKLRKELSYLETRDSKGPKAAEREKTRKIRILQKQYRQLKTKRR